jgi:hypothetical protein
MKRRRWSGLAGDAIKIVMRRGADKEDRAAA